MVVCNHLHRDVHFRRVLFVFLHQRVLTEISTGVVTIEVYHTQLTVWAFVLALIVGMPLLQLIIPLYPHSRSN